MVGQLVGTSVAIRCVRAAVGHLATQHTPLILVGETGTGKSFLARIITAAGPRADAAFVSIDGAARDSAMSATDIAYAWAAAAGGTLFVDHLGEMPTALQRALGTLLASNAGAASCPRLIAVSQCRPHCGISLESFQRASLGRSHRLVIHLPALRHRPEDIPALAEHFLAQGRTGGTHHTLAARTVTRLQHHGWPGNVRELDNVLRRAMVLAGGRGPLQPRDIVFDARAFAARSRALLGGAARRVRLRDTP